LLEGAGKIASSSKNRISEYQYYLKDHLGNTRVTFTTEPKTISFSASFETENAADEEDIYDNIAETRVTFNSADANSDGGNEVVQVNNAQPMGVGISLPVGAGDKLDMNVYGYYEGGSGYSTNVGLTEFIGAVAGGFGGINGGTEAQQATYDAFNNAISGIGFTGTSDDLVPAAYLNYILFDESMQYYQHGHAQISSSANANHEKVSLDDIEISKAGYVFVYLSNESNSANPVYFDDMEVTVKEHPVIQRENYYPFGLTFNSYNRITAKGNNYKFNDKERIGDLDLGWDDFTARTYMPDLGRFLQVDPRADVMTAHTPYHFGFNNPIMMVDPTGMMPQYHYDWDTGKYYKTKRSGKKKEVSFEEAIGSVTQSQTKNNVAIGIEGEATMEMLKSLDYDRGSWHILIAGSFSEANQKLSNYLGGNQIDNLMIFAHGNNRGGVIKPYGDGASYIGSSSIKKVLQAQQRGISISGGALEITAIQSMASNIKDDGRMIFSTCWACKGENGRSLATQLNKLTGQRVNIFLNQDFSQRRYYNGYLEVWTGKGLTNPEDVDRGWVQVAPNGEIFELRSMVGKKGNIRLDSRNGRSPVNIE